MKIRLSRFDLLNQREVVAHCESSNPRPNTHHIVHHMDSGCCFAAKPEFYWAE